MHLEKWYADWVDGNGRPHILYLARLGIGPVRLGYCASLGQQRHARTRMVWRDKHMPLPCVKANAVHWPLAAGHGHLQWSASARPGPRVLWQQPAGRVVWEPVVCNGLVRNQDGQCLGRGYVERLVLSVAPWKLGLRTLRWGRFCGTHHSLIWIEWLGRHPLRLALLDGCDEALHGVDRSQVRTATTRLEMHAAQPIVHDSLGTGALKRLGGLRRLARPDFLQGVESKWMAQAQLHMHGQVADSGHVIYEEVQWP
ncbi:MAG: hypothetical protein Q4A28_09465 [Brachymonas sp.]|nr:hypothetical protein [Brachymonas sp.]